MAVRELRSFFLSFFLSFFRFNVVGVINACVKISKERERERDVSSTVFRARRRLTLFFLSFSVLHSKGVVVGVFRKQRLESSNETLWR